MTQKGGRGHLSEEVAGVICLRRWPKQQGQEEGGSRAPGRGAEAGSGPPRTEEVFLFVVCL